MLAQPRSALVWSLRAADPGAIRFRGWVEPRANDRAGFGCYLPFLSQVVTVVTTVANGISMRKVLAAGFDRSLDMRNQGTFFVARQFDRRYRRASASERDWLLRNPSDRVDHGDPLFREHRTQHANLPFFTT